MPLGNQRAEGMVLRALASHNTAVPCLRRPFKFRFCCLAFPNAVTTLALLVLGLPAHRDLNLITPTRDRHHVWRRNHTLLPSWSVSCLAACLGSFFLTETRMSHVSQMASALRWACVSLALLCLASDLQQANASCWPPSQQGKCNSVNATALRKR